MVTLKFVRRFIKSNKIDDILKIEKSININRYKEILKMTFK